MVPEVVHPAVTQADYAAYVAAGVALVVGAGSFMASWLTNRNARAQQRIQLQHASEQLRIQLQHTADQRDKDRAMALRRDVYLPAFEAIVRAQGLLGRVIDPRNDIREIGQKMLADQATLSKVHLVGSEETVRALLAYMNTLMPAYFELLALRIPLEVRHGAINTEQSLREKSLAEMEQSNERMKQTVLSATPDQTLQQRLSEQFDFEREDYKSHSDAKNKLLREQNAAMRLAMQRMGELAVQVTGKIPDALTAARKEIELPFDPTEYRRLIEQQQEIVLRAVRDFLDQIMPAPDGPAPAADPAEPGVTP
jgi:hypothetical protein